jgi:hypothetical protein
MIWVPEFKMRKAQLEVHFDKEITHTPCLSIKAMRLTYLDCQKIRNTWTKEILMVNISVIEIVSVCRYVRDLHLASMKLLI